MSNGMLDSGVGCVLMASQLDFNEIGDKCVWSIREDLSANPAEHLWRIQRDEATDTYMITSQRTDRVLFESKKDFNGIGDKCVATSATDKNEQQPGKWRWRIEMDTAQDGYIITNAATGGVLFRSERLAVPVGGGGVDGFYGVATSSVDKHAERAGKWRWRMGMEM